MIKTVADCFARFPVPVPNETGPRRKTIPVPCGSVTACSTALTTSFPPTGHLKKYTYYKFIHSSRVPSCFNILTSTSPSLVI